MRQNLFTEFYALSVAILIVLTMVAACSGNHTPAALTVAEATATVNMLSTAIPNTATLVPTNQPDATSTTKTDRKTQRPIRKLTDAAQLPTLDAMETRAFLTMETAEASHRATSIAFDTAVPLPTAEPLIITAGEGLTATARQAGALLQVVLPKTSFWASEFVDAQIHLQNNSAESLVIPDPLIFWITIVDERGHRVVNSPWDELKLTYGSPLTTSKQFAPGEIITATQQFQVPTEFRSHTYSLWVSTVLDRQIGSSIRLDAGPIPLDIQQADTAHQLRVHLQADETGYKIQVTDGLSRTVTVPVTSYFNVQSSVEDGWYYSGLDARQIEAKWDQEKKQGDIVRLWVWAEDYATTFATLTIPGETTSLP